MAQENIKPLTTANSVVVTPEGEVGVLVLHNDPVTIIGTEKAKYLETGKAIVVHRSMAQKFVDDGLATYEDSSDEDKSKQLKKAVEKASV